MPLLPKSDPSWDALPKSVSELLPDLPEISADAGNAPAFSSAKGQYVAKAAEIFQLSSQVSLGSMLVNVGMPLKSAFDLMLDALDVDVKSEFAASLMKGGKNLMEAWKGIQEEGEGGATLAEVSVETKVGIGVDAASAIPVAGQIIRIAWAIGKTLYNMVKIARDTDAYKHNDDMKTLFPATMFNPQLDNIVLNAALSDLANKKDWSRRWGPPSLGTQPWSFNQPDYRTIFLESGGIEIVRIKGRGDGPAGPGTGEMLDWTSDGWTGMIPGTPYLHQGIQVNDRGVPTDMGEILLPSARQILVWIWGAVMGHKSEATPSMYCVDSNVLGAWEGYIHDLHVYIHENLDASSSTKQKIIDHYNKRGTQKVFGWGTSIKPVANEWDNYWPSKQARDLRARQMGMLDTLMCAYVDGKSAAIDKDPGMKSRWETRRRQLLEHPARCDVDLTSVPDWEYRDELRSRNVGAPACFSASLGFAARPMTPPPDFPAGTTYGVPKKPKKKKTKNMLLPATFVFVTGAGAYWAYKSGALKP